MCRCSLVIVIPFLPQQPGKSVNRLDAGIPGCSRSQREPAAHRGRPAGRMSCMGFSKYVHMYFCVTGNTTKGRTSRSLQGYLIPFPIVNTPLRYNGTMLGVFVNSRIGFGSTRRGYSSPYHSPTLPPLSSPLVRLIQD